MLDSLLADPLLEDLSWSIMIVPPSGTPLLHDPDRLLRTASVGKLFLLTRTAELITEGSLDPAEELSRSTVEPVADSGLWQHLRTDTLPIADIATLIGAASDNWATNVLLRRVGLDSVQRLAATLCDGGSQLWDAVRDHRGPDQPETPARAAPGTS
ncbi:serine hydrolase [Naumannella halotolerans]|uniref:serine hydrolase n=1 Tax=Naumannella halotolerans TaxID=993414 RepID=UPI00370D32C5